MGKGFFNQNIVSSSSLFFFLYHFYQGYTFDKKVSTMFVNNISMQQKIGPLFSHLNAF